MSFSLVLGDGSVDRLIVPVFFRPFKEDGPAVYITVSTVTSMYIVLVLCLLALHNR
jgi:hypothetical protein